MGRSVMLLRCAQVRSRDRLEVEQRFQRDQVAGA
jgi:hypothetical protein